MVQNIENNEIRTQDFSQVDSTDDFGHLYDEAPNQMVQTGFLTESAQDGVDPSLPQFVAQKMIYNENRAMIPQEDSYDPSRPIHLLQTGFVSDAGLDDMSLASATARDMAAYEKHAMTQSLDRNMNNISI